MDVDTAPAASRLPEPAASALPGSAAKALPELADGQLAAALSAIGQDETLRRLFVRACLSAESQLKRTGSVRDEVTGPIVDALHRDAGLLRKKLATGEVFEFAYRSRIAREFVMSTPEAPDHVWEPQTTKLLVALARHARHVVVGGAYFGDHAVLIARSLAPHGGICHAFEPNPELATLLAHNAWLNGLDNLRTHRLGLWSESGVSMRLVGEDANAYPEPVGNDANAHATYPEPVRDDANARATYPQPAATSGPPDDDTFSTIRIDHYVAQTGIDGVDLLMLDIEGGELAALHGAAGQLAQDAGHAPAVVFEVNRQYVDWSDGLPNTDIVRFLVGHGYEVFAVRDFHANVDTRGLPIELIPAESVYLEGPPHGFNMVAVKDPTRLSAVSPLGYCKDVSPKLLMHKDPALHHPTVGWER